jgi:hypothetical protein
MGAKKPVRIDLTAKQAVIDLCSYGKCRAHGQLFESGHWFCLHHSRKLASEEAEHEIARMRAERRRWAAEDRRERVSRGIEGEAISALKEIAKRWPTTEAGIFAALRAKALDPEAE